MRQRRRRSLFSHTWTGGANPGANLRSGLECSNLQTTCSNLCAGHWRSWRSTLTELVYDYPER